MKCSISKNCQYASASAKLHDISYMLGDVFVEYVSGVRAYSIGQYCKSHGSDSASAMQPFADATAMYGYYAKSCFSE